jgi:hypothetical protein
VLEGTTLDGDVSGLAAKMAEARRVGVTAFGLTGDDVRSLAEDVRPVARLGGGSGGLAPPDGGSPPTASA